MAWWNTSNDCLDSIVGGYNLFHTYRKYFSEHIGNAYTYLLAPNNFMAMLEIIKGLQDLDVGLQWLTNYDFDYHPPWAIPYFLKNYAGAEITWKTICGAWVKDDFEGRFWTISIIDRMRQIMWNEPFDITCAAR
ncbi:unnamed protein product, partial [marine sediment metagenome]